jgi:predicted  nucleic acid-binding Zn-ribbon protein
MGDEAVETLKLIWGEMKTLNARIERTNDGLRELRGDVAGLKTELTGVKAEAVKTNERLAGLEAQTGEMRDRIVESDMRLATEVVALAGIMKDVRDNLQAAGQTRFALIEERIARLEEKVS